MEIYIFFFVVICLYSFLGINNRSHEKIYYFGVLALILFAGLRGNGFDWQSYQDIYSLVQSGYSKLLSGTTFIEYGFQLLCWISPSYRFLIFLTAVISIGLTLSGLYKFSKPYLPLLGLVIFFTTVFPQLYMGQIRQALATSFVIWGFYYFYVGKNKTTILLVFVACLFHLSAFLGFLVFIIPRRQLSVSTYAILCILAVVLSSYIIPLFSNLLQISEIGVIKKLTYYSNTELEELGVNLTIIIRIATLLFAVKLNKRKSPDIAFVCNLYLCGILIYLLFGFLPQLGGRGALYFTIFEVVLVPYIVYRFRKMQLMYIGGYIAVLLLSTVRFYTIFTSELGYNSFIPYNPDLF